MTSVLEAPLCTAKAFSPGHITGFIEKPGKVSYNDSNNLHIGSKGAGFSIDHGITTTVKIFDHDLVNYQISINGIRVQDAEVSRWVIEQYLRLTDQRCYINIEHESTIPIGFGLGSSGAGALSLSYALNDALNIGLSTIEAAQIAHNAEIACKTGLGTVIAEFAGGFEIRTNAGAPGVGTIEKIELDQKVLIFCISQISTKSFLSRNHCVLTNGLGEKMLKNLEASKDARNFLKLSYCFANHLGLTEGRCKLPMQKLKSRGFDSGIALFGETLFTLVPSDQIEEAKGCLESFNGNLMICNIDNEGARML
jgi:pantoate kinase